MSTVKFALKRSEFLKKRTWEIWYMDKDNKELNMNIEEALHYMRNQFSIDKNTDLAVCRQKNCNLYIDGTKSCVTVSLSMAGAEFPIGYEITSLKHYKWTNDELNLKNSIISNPLLKDWFSSLMLDKNFEIL